MYQKHASGWKIKEIMWHNFNNQSVIFFKKKDFWELYLAEREKS